jgi:hypothetical protein
MSAILAAIIDSIHAILMIIWIVGLPLLFWRRYPRLSHLYAYYVIAFVVINQLSFLLLGECVLTTLARFVYQSDPNRITSHRYDEWFVVRISQAVFNLAPSHRLIRFATKALIFVMASTWLVMFFRRRVREDRI